MIWAFFVLQSLTVYISTTIFPQPKLYFQPNIKNVPLPTFIQFSLKHCPPHSYVLSTLGQDLKGLFCHLNLVLNFNRSLQGIKKAIPSTTTWHSHSSTKLQILLHPSPPNGIPHVFSSEETVLFPLFSNKGSDGQLLQ